MEKTIKIVIVDDNLVQDDPLMIELKEKYQNVILFDKPINALKFINDNLKDKMIVLLDIRLDPQMNGHEVLDNIRKQTKLIPVIIWSAYDGEDDDFTDFINNDAFFYVNKSNDSDYLLSIVEKAVNCLRLDIATNIENWIFHHNPDENEIILIDNNGKKYTAKDVIKEIRMQSDFGVEIQEKVQKMAVNYFLVQENNKKPDEGEL